MTANADAFAEAKKIDLETKYDDAEVSAARTDDKDHQEQGKVETHITACVLGHLFHIMDIVKVPMHHDFKTVYFQALWEEFFIMNAGDEEGVKKAMEKKGCSWSITTTLNFDYITLRVKRTVPPHHMLYCRVKAIFDCFYDNKYTKTHSLLLNYKARKKSDFVLKEILQGEYSDPPRNF